MSYAGAGKLDSSESCVTVSYPRVEETPSCSYDNPFVSAEVSRVTSSCSIQCLNCKRLTSKLSRVYNDMYRLKRQNEILLIQKLFSKPQSDAYAAVPENSFLEKSQSQTAHISELVEESEIENPPREATESQESSLVNFVFSINVNFVPEKSNLGSCDSTKSSDDKSCGKPPCPASENPDAGITPQLQAMITIQMKMMDELFKAPTITCIEKSGSGLGPKWLIELETPNLTAESTGEDHGSMKEKMHKEVTHLLQTIREFFDHQIKESRSDRQPPDAMDLSQTGAIPKKRPAKDRSDSQKLSSSSGKSASLVHSPDSGTSSSSFDSEYSDLSCPACSMIFPHDFKKKEKDEHRKCHLWPRYEDP